MRSAVIVILMLAVVALAPAARAGTPEAPEVVDAAGDCEFAPGNRYADIVAAWISDETSADFNVNIQLSEWLDPVANGAGFTLQFSHQGVKYGVLAAYFANSWEYGNGFVTEDAEVQAWNDTTGSFAASPPVLTVLFQKAHFPHTNAADNQLVDFWGGSIDLKPMMPFFLLPTESPAYPPPLACDIVTGTTPYVFQVGDHSMHQRKDVVDANATDDDTSADDANLTAQQGADQSVASQPDTSIPGPGAALVALAAIVVVLSFRRR